MSILKKLKTLSKGGVKPVLDGVHYFKHADSEVEARALERARVCRGCDFFVDEPLEMFRIRDERLPVLSGKMCGECGCVLSYKLRQNEGLCSKLS